LKVLHIITGLNVGGAENMLAKLIEAASPDISQEVVSLLEPGPLAERISARNVRVHSVGMKRGLPTPRAAFELTKIVRSVRPDVLHGWMYHGNLAASFARRMAAGNARLLWNVRHSLADPKSETRMTQALLWLSARISGAPDAIIYNSQAALDQHSKHGFSASRALVLPNGFDCDKFRPDPQARKKLEEIFGIEPSRLVVGCIARQHPMKDHANLIEAVSLARRSGLDIHLLMVGAGMKPPPDDLAARISKLLPPDRVTTAEARFDVSDWLAGLDVLAVPSAWGEGFPNVIGEALCSGVPVIATDVGDSRIIVGDAGETVCARDPEAFAEALRRILSGSREDRAALGTQGRRRMIERYSLPSITGEYEKLYRSISDTPAASASLTAAAI
jgi:glycosyltransferase involved in cell wall biosynthesis